MCSFAQFAPQAWRTWRGRRDLKVVAGLSLSMCLIAFVGYLLWGWYTLAAGAYWARVCHPWSTSRSRCSWSG